MIILEQESGGFLDQTTGETFFLIKWYHRNLLSGIIMSVSLELLDFKFESRDRYFSIYICHPDVIQPIKWCCVTSDTDTCEWMEFRGIRSSKTDYEAAKEPSVKM